MDLPAVLPVSPESCCLCRDCLLDEINGVNHSPELPYSSTARSVKEAHAVLQSDRSELGEPTNAFFHRDHFSAQIDHSRWSI